MKTPILHFILWLLMVLACIGIANAQTYNATYVHSLYAKYPAVKSTLCKSCKLWINPYYKSIADTTSHMPLITYEHFTKLPKYTVKRTGIFAAWHSVSGQANEDAVYTEANQKSKVEIAKGHCEAWILNSFSPDAAILSDTYTFNAACECQGQNTGTELASEQRTRELLKTYDVDIWCGTIGNAGFFTDGHITDVLPVAYWKVIRYNGITECYYMPNLPTETQTVLPKRIVTYQVLCAKLGFDPEKILN